MDRDKRIEDVVRERVAAFHPKLTRNIIAIPTGSDVLVRIRGIVGGSSISYAARIRSRIRREIGELALREGLDITVSLDVNDAVERTEKAIAAAIGMTLGAPIQNVHLDATPSGLVSVVVVIDQRISDATTEKLHSEVKELIQQASGYLRDVKFVSSEPGAIGPSDALILRAVRVTQPASIGVVRGYLESNGFKVPAGKWLRHRLDRLRQDKAITADARGLLRLSGKSAGLLRGRVYRQSPDVERALLLAKRWR